MAIWLLVGLEHRQNGDLWLYAYPCREREMESNPAAKTPPGEW